MDEYLQQEAQRAELERDREYQVWLGRLTWDCSVDGGPPCGGPCCFGEKAG